MTSLVGVETAVGEAISAVGELVGVAAEVGTDDAVGDGVGGGSAVELEVAVAVVTTTAVVVAVVLVACDVERLHAVSGMVSKNVRTTAETIRRLRGESITGRWFRGDAPPRPFWLRLTVDPFQADSRGIMHPWRNHIDSRRKSEALSHDRDRSECGDFWICTSRIDPNHLDLESSLTANDARARAPQLFRIAPREGDLFGVSHKMHAERAFD